MFVEIPMSSGFPSLAMASLLSDRLSGFATTSMSGFQGLEAVRESHLTSGMEDSFEIDTAPEKQISYTFADGDSHTSNSRVTFSILVTSEISAGLHFSCFGQVGLDVVRALDVILDERQSQVYLLPRRCRADTPLGTSASHQACGFSDRAGITAEMDGRSSGPEATPDVHHACSSPMTPLLESKAWPCAPSSQRCTDDVHLSRLQLKDPLS